MTTAAASEPSPGAQDIMAVHRAAIERMYQEALAYIAAYPKSAEQAVRRQESGPTGAPNLGEPVQHEVAQQATTEQLVALPIKPSVRGGETAAA